MHAYVYVCNTFIDAIITLQVPHSFHFKFDSLVTNNFAQIVWKIVKVGLIFKQMYKKELLYVMNYSIRKFRVWFGVVKVVCIMQSSCMHILW